MELFDELPRFDGIGGIDWGGRGVHVSILVESPIPWTTIIQNFFSGFKRDRSKRKDYEIFEFSFL